VHAVFSPHNIQAQESKVSGSAGVRNWNRNRLDCIGFPGTPLVENDIFCCSFQVHLVCHPRLVSPALLGTKVLLRAGAEVDAVNTYGQTPLIKAVRQKHASTMAVLLEAGANQALRNSEGYQVH